MYHSVSGVSGFIWGKSVLCSRESGQRSLSFLVWVVISDLKVIQRTRQVSVKLYKHQPKLTPFLAGKHFGDIHPEQDTFMKRPLDM